MSGFISAVFPDIVSASEAIDRLTAVGVDFADINVVLSSACVGLATRSRTSLGTVVGGAARSKAGHRFRVTPDSEAFVAGPLVATIVDDGDYHRTRGILRALFDSLAPSADALERSLDRGAVIVAVDAQGVHAAFVERALFAEGVA